MKMSKLKIGAFVLFAVYFALVVHYGQLARTENALVDDNGNPSMTGESSTTANTIIKVKIDPVSGAMIVSGLGLSACDTQHIDKVGYAASATGTITAPATATTFMVQTESTNTDNVYVLPGSTVPTALTGIELLPTDSMGGTMRIKQLTILNGSAAAAATVTVFWCY